MRNNDLSSLDATSFAGFTALQTLTLDFNNISFAASDTISAFQQPNLVKVTFTNNPLPSVSCPPSYYNSINSVPAGGLLPACFICPSGSYCPGNGAVYACPAGRYSNLVRQSSIASCLPCSVGTYNEQTGQTAVGCINCAVGTASNVVGSNSSASCALCGAGSYAGGIGLALCQLCPSGTYNNITGSVSSAFCISCPLNTHSSAVGATSLANCTPCSPGTFTTTTGATLVSQCTSSSGCPIGTYCVGGSGVPCPLGAYCAVAGAANYALCPVGTWGDTLGLSSAACSGSCQAGFFGNASGQSSQAAACFPCPPGFVVSFPGASQCYPCLPGTFAPAPGLPVCATCPPGSYSNVLGASASSTCVSCPNGTYSQVAGSTIIGCQLCAAGTFSSVAFATSPSDCTSCSAGFAAPAPGLASCAACRAGSYSAPPFTSCTPCGFGFYAPDDGSPACLACPAGTTTSGTGATALGQCVDPSPCGVAGTYCVGGIGLKCPLGFYCPGGLSPAVACPPSTWGAAAALATSACSGSCPAGFFGTVAGAQNQSEACQACPSGSAVNFAGATQCFECAPGSYADAAGLARCALCAAGRYSNAVGSTSGSSCLSCPQGTYGLVPGSTISGCNACAAGSASAALFATAPSTCVSCSAGFIASAPGLASCTACKAGSYSAPPFTSCTPCDFGSFAPSVGAGACTLCPNGTSTSSTGATSASQCTSSFTRCPPGMQPVGVAAPTSMADCIVLTCAPPLLPSADNSSCVGCPAGARFSYTKGSCAACDSSLVCPGFSISFLATDGVSNGGSSSPAAGIGGSSFSSGSATGGSGAIAPPPSLSSSTSKSVDSCVAQMSTTASSTAASAPSLAQSPSSSSPSKSTPISGSALSGSIIIVIAIGSSAVVVVALLALAATLCIGDASKRGDATASQPPRVCVVLRKALIAVDLFSIRKPTTPRAPVTSNPTTLGGFCTAAGIVTILCLAIVLVIRRNEDNVASVSTLAVLDPVTLATQLATPPATSITSTMGCSKWSGVRIRIFSPTPPVASSLSASSEASSPCATLASIPGAFSFAGLTSGSWSRSTIADCGDGRSALLLTCASCVFTASSTLSLVLPYQCQSLYLDAASVDGSGALSVANVAASASSAQPAALLKSVAWTLAPVLSVVDDTVNARTTRGLDLIPLSQSSTYASTNASSLQPLSASVLISISLPLQSYYASTVLTEKISTLQLLSSIVGLAGLMGAFGVLASIASSAKKAEPIRRVSSYLLNKASTSSIVERKASSSKSLASSGPHSGGSIFFEDSPTTAAGTPFVLTNPMARPTTSTAVEGGKPKAAFEPFASQMAFAATTSRVRASGEKKNEGGTPEQRDEREDSASTAHAGHLQHLKNAPSAASFGGTTSARSEPSIVAGSEGDDGVLAFDSNAAAAAARVDDDVHREHGNAEDL